MGLSGLCGCTHFCGLCCSCEQLDLVRIHAFFYRWRCLLRMNRSASAYLCATRETCLPLELQRKIIRSARKADLDPHSGFLPRRIQHEGTYWWWTGPYNCTSSDTNTTSDVFGGITAASALKALLLCLFPTTFSFYIVSDIFLKNSS